MNNRTNHVIKNFIYGVGSQILLLIFPFILRTIFIHTLGVEYLGISGLFSSVLNMLSIAELGIGNVVIFSLYKPVAEKDYKRISALLNFYKILYRSISVFVFFMGVLLIPFLKYIINLPENMEHILLYYLLYVANSAISYLYIYKISVIRANEEQYLISFYTTISTILIYILQAISLVIWHNFTLYLVIQIVVSFTNNYVLSKRAEKNYPYIKQYNEHLSFDEIKSIIPNMFSMLLFKIEDLVVNSTDNLYISGLVGTQEIGYLSNYYTLKNALNKVVNIIYEAIYTSVGNLNASSEEKKQKEIFDYLVYLFGGISSLCAVGFIVLSNNIITIWLGEQFQMSNYIVMAISFNLFISIYLWPVYMFRNTTIVFNYTKKALIASMIFNIIFSFYFGLRYGIAGILFATVLSRLFSTFWYEPVVLFKKIFPNYNVIRYFLVFIKNLFIVVCSSCLITLIQNQLNGNLAYNTIVVFFLCIVIQNLMYITMNGYKNFKFYFDIIVKKICCFKEKYLCK